MKLVTCLLVMLVLVLFDAALGWPVEPEQRYLFYLHGKWIELHGLHHPHPTHGLYEYEHIVRAFADRGYEVISEVRRGEVETEPYARKVADQIRDLFEEGVPPRNITVVGHSKGGQMALIVASLVQEARVNYVIMAGCGKRGAMFRKGYERFLQSQARDLDGRILSLYDSSDREAGSCQEAFDAAPHADTKEVVLRTGRGHGLFYAPRSAWVDVVVDWAR